jgi:hypothetical protein
VLAVDRLGVALDLFERGVAGDGGDLVHRASGFREPSRRRLAQAVNDAALRQSGVVAMLAEPCREAMPW